MPLSSSGPSHQRRISATSAQFSDGSSSPPRHVGHAVDAGRVADHVAERAPRRAGHAQRPARVPGHVEQLAQVHARGIGQAVLQVLVALAHQRQVEGQHQRRAAGGLGALDQAPGEGTVAHHVELEPEAGAGVFGHVLDGADAHGGQREGHAEGPRRPCREDFAVGVLHAQRAHRGERQRHGQALAEQRGDGAAPIDVDGHALAQQQLLQVGLVGAVGALGPGARVGVVVEHPRHAALGQGTQVLDAGDAGHGAPPSSSLPGLRMPAGSSARLIAPISARSCGLRVIDSQGFFSSPMPCSADTEPPRARSSA